MTIWHLEVERIRIVGAGAGGMPAVELHSLVEQAVRTALETAPLPNGRTVRASVAVNVASLSGGHAIANAVSQGVTRAIAGDANG